MVELNWDPAVEKLIEHTLSNRITWNPHPGLSSQRDEVKGEVYTARVQERLVAVYEYRFRSYDDLDAWDWTDDVAIEFITHDGTLEWRWPQSAHRWRLLDSIRYQRSQAGSFLESFLKT
jgi:hypothetical protein